MNGSHLKRLRVHYKGKQKELAEHLKIPQLELKTWESETFTPDDEKVRDYFSSLSFTAPLAQGLTFDHAMSLIEKMDGENLEEIRPTISHSRPGWQSGQREIKEGEIVQGADKNQNQFGKFSFSVGESLQVSDQSWIRVTIGIEMPFPLEQFDTVKDNTIMKARTILKEEMTQVYLAVAEEAGKSLRVHQDGDESSVQEDIGATSEGAPRINGASLTKEAGDSPFAIGGFSS